MLEILYQDEHLVAINKPHDLLVHRSRIASDVNLFALQILRDQIGQRVYPIHRLDRKTSGVLLFGLNEDAHRIMQKEFATKNVKKQYLAVVRGYTKDQQIIDYPLKKENGNLQEAFTRLKTLERIELNLPFGKHSTSRYSLIAVYPTTGRKHQIRKHMSHIDHPIVGDRPHGCNKQNKLFKEKFGMMIMMLHALQLNFKHPFLNTELSVVAKPSNEFFRIVKALGFSHHYPSTH